MATPSFNHIFPFLRELPRCPLMFNYWLPHSLLLAIQISGGSRGGLPLCLDQTEAWKAEKIFFETAPPLISEFGWMPPPHPHPPCLKVCIICTCMYTFILIVFIGWREISGCILYFSRTFWQIHTHCHVAQWSGCCIYAHGKVWRCRECASGCSRQSKFKL